MERPDMPQLPIRELGFAYAIIYTLTVIKLLLIRHGQSLGNLEGRMEGWASTGLTPEGWCQARRLGQRLAREGWQPTHAYCSPLKRATETWHGLWSAFNQERRQASHPALDIPLRLEDNLKEYNNGVLAGLTWAEAQERYPDLCHALEQSPDWLPIPQAETPTMGRQRAQGFIDKLLQRHQNGDQIWIVSHHWIMQQLMACVLGCDRTWGFAIYPTGLFEVWLDRTRWQQDGENLYNTELWQLKRFNDCEHYSA
jgi:probable phosphoglycerate mutase